MFSTIFEFWYDLPILLRVGLSLLLIGISVLTYFTGRIWISPGAVGMILLFFCGAGRNSDGYNF
jgi:hypothetical protein